MREIFTLCRGQEKTGENEGLRRTDSLGGYAAWSLDNSRETREVKSREAEIHFPILQGDKSFQ